MKNEGKVVYHNVFISLTLFGVQWSVIFFQVIINRLAWSKLKSNADPNDFLSNSFICSRVPVEIIVPPCS